MQSITSPVPFRFSSSCPSPPSFLSENEAGQTAETSKRTARKRRMELRRVNFTEDEERKRQKMMCIPATEDDVGKFSSLKERIGLDSEKYPKFGAASVCGRRRDMEDAVAIHPAFCGNIGEEQSAGSGFHYFGVYDGHGCSHVAMRCRDRLHELVKEELQTRKELLELEWRTAMDTSFNRMDREAVLCTESSIGASCRCELQGPDSDAVGSTAVVSVVTPDKIIVANCGDSRAVLCRNGKAIPLSIDHKPDRPDELKRIHAAGGRVIYWDGARVLGVLAMSRAIGDNYLKPYVSSDPEVTITNRTADDVCLILASDGLWDVVSNETACGVASMCLKGKVPATKIAGSDGVGVESSDKACSDASVLLTKLALARRSTDNVSIVVVDLRLKSE